MNIAAIPAVTTDGHNVAMQSLEVGRYLSAFAAAGRYACICGLLILAPLAAFAQQTKPQPPADPMRHNLENRQFVGFMQALGDDEPDKDVYSFKDGRFTSQGCREWGFAPAPYWVRREGDDLRFLAELTSPEHGTMRYEGVFDGTEIKGTVRWRKERWYWTMERDYRFAGKPAVATQ